MNEKQIITLNEEGLRYFFDRCSFAGMLILYICKFSYQSKKGFTVQGLEKKISALPHYYTFGFIVALVSFGVIEHVVTNDTERIYTITKYNELVLSKVEIELERMIKDKPVWQNNVKDVKNYFI